MTDEDAILAHLIGRIAGGDRACVKHLYDRCSMKLLGQAMRILNDRQDAEDVIQDVFVTIWRKAGEYDATRAGPTAWLVTIARNRAIDRIRARRVRPSAPIDDAMPVPDENARADSLADQNDSARTVQQALSTLPPQHAQVIRSAYLDGLSYEDIAQQQGVPVGTVKTWVFRGLRRMRTGLEPDHV